MGGLSLNLMIFWKTKSMKGKIFLPSSVEHSHLFQQCKHDIGDTACQCKHAQHGHHLECAE